MPTEDKKPADVAAEDRKKIILAYNDAPTREAKAEIVKKHPWLEQIYSVGNHS